jgi:CubicO group peptidase (beta-lactamase class C family)
MHMSRTEPNPRLRARNIRVAIFIAIALLSANLCAGALETNPSAASAAEPASQAGTIATIAKDAMKQYHLMSIIVQVTSGGKQVYTGAMGESMSGVPATPDMHFRNGAMAFTYMSTMLLELVDQNKVNLDDKLSKFFPDLPEADHITLKNLANMTSGYADYVYEPAVLNGVYIDPFRQWTPEELIHIGVSAPMMFSPGANWGYCHTNYVILGRVLEKITRMPLAEGMQKYIFGPMDLKQTQSINTPQIPSPVLHTFSSERRAELHVPAAIPFYEESTFWNPSWTTAEGAIQITDISDMTKSMVAVGEGKVLSKSSWQAQVGPTLVDFGHTDPKCSVCRQNSTVFNYGLGVVNFGPWNTQTKSFGGSGGTVGYLSSQKLAITVVTTVGPGAFDAEGNYKAASDRIFVALANALAPNTLPKELMQLMNGKK